MKKFSTITFCMVFFFGIVKSNAQTTAVDTTKIDSGWEFSQAGMNNWMPATVPGTVHTDLLENEEIEDPFYRTNEKDQQWIDKVDWTYKTSFSMEDSMLKRDQLEMVFHGLDTYADVYINDTLILEANNMFRTWRVDVKPHLKPGDNPIKIVFHSPIKKGLEEMEAFGLRLPASNDQSENGGLGPNKVSIFTRKAGYHYGWDWGPRFVTSGIWRPIELLAWDDTRIEDVFVKQPKVTKKVADLVAAVSLELEKPETGEITVEDLSDGKTLVKRSVKLQKGQQQLEMPFSIKNPRLWWSNGLGEPNMYDFKVSLKTAHGTVSKQIRTGLRDLELVRKPDGKGESFYFMLNGVKVFAKGANYIPSDMFLPRVSKEEYNTIISDAADANMNMLRVWGGGIYENDEFYELCDEKGIMVWQDFMFACSMYPDNQDFYNNVEEEIKDNLIRLRNHPSIALWCGNNEINTAWAYYDDDAGWGWTQRYDDEEAERINKAYLKVFQELLPDLVEEYTDDAPYWPSSPQAGYEPEKLSGDQTVNSGDMHYWGVWHGSAHFSEFENHLGRFMSEYGFQSFPNFQTVKAYTKEGDWDIESEVMTAHQRSGIGNLQIKKYMEWYYSVPDDFQQFLYLSQVLQAYGIEQGIEAHRRNMPHTMGTLYWQLNDVWPVASWSSTDYYRNWKALHYKVRDVYKPVIISATKNDKDKFQVYVVSDKQKPIKAELKIDLMDFSGKNIKSISKHIKIPANSSTLEWQKSLKSLLKNEKAANMVANLKLVKNNQELTTALYYFAEPKDLDLKKPDIELQVVKGENGKPAVELSANTLVKNIMLSVPDQQIHFSDNYFDMLPGKTYKVNLDTAMTVAELKGKVKMRHLKGD